MAVDKFKFISPGVFIDEIDESALPPLPERMGPVIVGRFAKGPANRPVKVESFKEFVQLFGRPSAGNPGGDIWRTGALTAPTYAAYAVQAWLRNNSPCTVYRVLGEHPSTAETSFAIAEGGLPGWRTQNTLSSSLTTAGGAYGLVVFPVHCGALCTGSALTGTLAAIWYVQNGTVEVDGPGVSGSAGATSSAGMLHEFEGGVYSVAIKNSTGTTVKAARFTFNKDSELYIRKVFNTDPTKTNTDITVAEDEEIYWLGETFDPHVLNSDTWSLAVTGTSYTGGDTTCAILGLQGDVWGGTNGDYADRRQSSQAARTGWFFSQDTRGEMTASFDPTEHTKDLFRFVAHDSGEHANRDFKISIQDIKVPTDNYNKYGSFTVLVRAAGDSDNNPIVLERFSGLNLDPTSTGYIKKVIGDVSYVYDENTKVIVEHGEWPNRSKYIRAEGKPIIEGNAEGLLPFGVYGPRVPITLQILSGTTNLNMSASATGEACDSWVIGQHANGLPSASLTSSHAAGHILHAGDEFTGSLQWPTTRCRVSSSEGDLVLETRAYFGYQSVMPDTRIFEQTNLDLLRGQPSGIVGDTNATASQHSWVFTLDDIVVEDNSAVWTAGSRALGDSRTASSSADTGGHEGLLGENWNRFTSPMFGGFDGLDVTEKDPFRNEYIGLTPTSNTNYAYHSMKRAIDTLSDSEFAEFDIATIPGITAPKLVTSLVNVCEDRGDAIAIIDAAGGYKPQHENDDDEQTRFEAGTIDTVVDTVKNNLQINSSYGCTFYPWVRIKDNVNNAVLYVPPSVVALGTFSSSQRKSAVWFAPAGFTRGGLSEGSAGLPVVGVRERLTSAQRDKLYDANINPIASFPAEGIVIFGQKTMQVTRSALDRINVRRLLIYLKKEISQIASRILFDQNVTATWDKFTGQVVPFLDGVKAGLGLTDFRVVLDESTTTPDLIDRNILYAKIYLKPARAIEFIALDFIITRSGASFDD